VASACGHLGRRRSRSGGPGPASSIPSLQHTRARTSGPALREQPHGTILEGLRKAGLSIPASGESSDSPGRAGRSLQKTDGPRSGGARCPGQVRAAGISGVAVLPIQPSRGTRAELKETRRGSVREIVTGPSRSRISGDRPRFDIPKVFQRIGGSAGDRQEIGRSLRHGKEACARRERSCASRYSSSLLRPAPISGREPSALSGSGNRVRYAGRSGSTNRFDGCRLERGSAQVRMVVKPCAALPRS
jgi:hypothetical protein